MLNKLRQTCQADFAASSFSSWFCGPPAPGGTGPHHCLHCPVGGQGRAKFGGEEELSSAPSYDGEGVGVGISGGDPSLDYMLEEDGVFGGECVVCT